MNIEQVKALLENRTVEEILTESLQNYLQVENSDYATLKQLYKESQYKRITEPIEYFEQSITDIKDNWEEYELLYELLADEESKSILCDMLAAKITLDTNYIEHAFSRDTIYFDNHIWEQLNNEVYVDCGAFDGDTILKFVAACPGYKEIYAFEAVKEVLERCKENLKELSNLPGANIHFLEQAVSDQRRELKFDAGTMRGESKASNQGTMVCTAVPIDSLQADITFIKMDIEGSEAEALQGATATIKKNTPKMAICIYHKPGDFWRIPKQVLSINSGYTFKIRQHDYEVYSETVLYCIPKKISNSERYCEPECKLNRLASVIQGLHILSHEEYDNWLQHGKDKKWFLKQLYGMNIQIAKLTSNVSELKDWGRSLEYGKEYLEGQTLDKESRITELEQWCKEVTAGKAYLETHVAELEKWTKQLEQGKAYIESQLVEKTKHLTELENWTKQLEQGKTYVEEQLAEKAKRLTELENWTKQLEDGKNYLEQQVVNKDLRIAELEQWSQEVTAGKAYVEEQWSEIKAAQQKSEEETEKLTQKLELLLGDEKIQKIIKKRHYEI